MSWCILAPHFLVTWGNSSQIEPKEEKKHTSLRGYQIVLLWTVSSHSLPVVIERVGSAEKERERRSSMSTSIRAVYTRPAVQRITLSAPSLSYRRAPITNKTWPERQSYIYEKKKKIADGVLSFYQAGTVRDVGHQTAQDRADAIRRIRNSI